MHCCDDKGNYVARPYQPVNDIQIEIENINVVFWAMTPCSLVRGYIYIGGIYVFIYPEAEDSLSFRNIAKNLSEKQTSSNYGPP
jgi:hypothetical protein